MAENFVVLLTPDHEPNHFRAEVIQSPAGTCSGKIILNFDFEDMVPTLKRFQVLIHPDSIENTQEPRTWSPQDLGFGLYRTFFADEKLKEKWQEARALSQDKLRLLLQFDPTDPKIAPLMRIPWELMTDGRDSVQMVCRNHMTLARLINPKPQIEIPILAGEQLRMLVVLSSPTDQEDFGLKAYREALEKKLDPLGPEIYVVENATKEGLFEVVKKERPFHFVHFVGHGSYMDHEGSWCFALEDDEKQTELVTGKELAVLLKPMEGVLRLVSLLTCDGGETDNYNGFNRFGSVAACLLMAGIDHCVAMQFPISFDGAEIFNKSFFPELLKTQNMDKALATIRREMDFILGQSLEWGTPVWFTRSLQPFIYKPPIQPTLHVNSILLNLEAKKICGNREHVSIMDFKKFFDGRKMVETSGYQKILNQFWAYKSQLHNRSRFLTIEGDANLSLFLGLGFVFNRTTPMHFQVLQTGQRGQSSEYWSTQVSPKPIHVDATPMSLQGEGKEILISIEVLREAEGSLREYLKTASLSVQEGFRFLIRTDEGDEGIDGQEALGLAALIGQKIRNINDAWTPSKIHFFFLGPKGFAFFLGRELNALNNVQLYEFQMPGYEPSIQLGRVGN